jgi:hypothetical protein
MGADFIYYTSGELDNPDREETNASGSNGYALEQVNSEARPQVL